MFPHSSSDQTQSPFIYTSPPILEMKPLANDEKASSGQDQDQHASSYSHLSAPFFEDDELFFSHFLSQQKLFVGGSNSQVETENSVAATHKATDNRKEECSNTVAEQIASKRTFPTKKIIGGAKSTGHRKRTGKKDRHSKICTAQGPRDRRMRLSLQIAREFFDLQDMLGFDKASKTIEWLFSKSRTAITELTESISHVKQTCSDDAAKSVSVTSDSEVVSENHGEIASDGDQRGFGADAESFNRMKTDRKLHIVARDSRNKARARARERTRKKMMIRGHELSKEIPDSVVPNPNSNLVQLCSSSPLETGDQESSFRSQDMKTSQKMVAEVEERCSHLLEHQIDSVSINGNFLGIVGAPTSSNLVLNHSPNDLAASSGGNTEEDFPGFPVNFSSNNNNNANMRPFCCTTSTNTKSSTENFQLRIPSAMGASLKSHELKQTSIFMTTYNTQEQMLNSIFRSTPNIQDQNRSSIFITSLNTQRQNPTTNFLATSINNNSLHSHFLGNEFS